MIWAGAAKVMAIESTDGQMKLVIHEMCILTDCNAKLRSILAVALHPHAP